MTQHMLAVGNWIMSDKCWNNLSATDQDLVEQAFANVSSTIEKGYEDAEQECLDEFQKEGLKIVYPDKQPFMDRLNLVFEKYPGWKDYYTRIQALEG